ncbi:MAG: PorT family protein [Saprospiraceae bacterium]|nr:PorT family protein [Saprospiraceae bacterium]
MKTYSALFVLLLITSTATAQVSLRPHAGFNSSSLSHASGVQFEDRLGSQFGLDLQLGGRFYVQPGIMWESATNELKQEFDERSNTFTINRIRVPFMMGYKVLGPQTSRLIDFRMFTGPNVSFTVSKDLGGDPLFNKDDFRNSVWGWNVGAGLDITILFVDVGYTFGLSEVFDSVQPGVRNNLFYANAGLRIGF